ncbi:MAG: D-alanine--D-alanine ligase [Clostridia bacterium]|nr:D-alanine--D-alanine ligase [Clostridia bacterium]
MKIAVICGGRSNERDVSLSTGAKVAAELRSAGHDVVYVDACEGIELDCTPEEAFTRRLPIPQHKVAETAPDVRPFFERREGFFGKNVIELCKAADVVFNALHGDEGENGKLQAAFDLLNIRYTGSGAQGCLLGMNKSLSKMMFHQHDIPTPEEAILHGESADEAVRKCAWLGYPCVVKPASLGSSVGVSIAHDEKEFRAAIREASCYEDVIIVEKYIKGREFSVGIVGGKVLPAIEIIPKEGFYDYKNKYQPGFTEEICPADIPTHLANEMAEAAMAVFKALDLSAYARVDFMADETGAYVLEANTAPGMTPTSLLPQEAAAAGMSFIELLETIIAESLKARG